MRRKRGGEGMDLEKQVGIGLKPNNDMVEISFRSLSENIKRNSIISLKNMMYFH